MKYEEFIELRDKLKARAVKSMDDGYARMRHVFKSETENQEEDNPINTAFFNSLSALIIQKANYVREPILR